MDEQRARGLIKSTFENSFNEEQYLRFLGELFNGQIDQAGDRTFDLYGQYIPDSFKEAVRRYKRLGTYTSPDGHEIDLLVVILKSESALDRARTMQRNFAAYHLKKRDKETAIIAYLTDDRDEWRFSMVRRESLVSFSDSGRLITKDELTPVRRFSFLVGHNERSHTAQQQLLPILRDDRNNPTLERLEEAFNIETVTKEFFGNYKERFLQLKDELDRLVVQNPPVKAEFDQKELETANFAKKLLGQIVFLYFLQKKGWLGVQKGQEWGSGSKTFLRQLFNREGISYDNFFNDILEPLFYEALAIERPDSFYERLNVKIPFLNGGLFEPVGNYDWRSVDVLIKNSVFQSIFETFDLYNFTVREDEPLEKEVAVDPEMLGKVFENLLEVTDRKSKGAFYTPREIVHYMCQESLINYLDTNVNVGTRPIMEETRPQKKLFELPPKKGEQLGLAERVPQLLIARDDLTTFIRFGELAKEHDTATQGKEKETRDYSFRMPESIRTHAKTLDDALATIKICDPAIGSGAFPVGMMHEIVKAREVLTTYLGSNDERTSYHFKRHAIQESLYGVDVDHGAIDIAKLRLWLSLVVDEADYRHIKPLPNLDYKIVCGNSLAGLQTKLYNQNLLADLEKQKRAFFDETNPKKKRELDLDIKTILTNLLGDYSQFNYTVYFSEVFQEGGFDVLIANPPYVRQERITEMKTDLKAQFADMYSGTSDLYVYFYSQGFRLLKRRGVLTYITPNKFMRANYGERLRLFLSTKTCLHTLIDFDDLPIFDATTYPLIVVARNDLPNSNEVQVVVIESMEEVNTLPFAAQNAYVIPQHAFTRDTWLLTSPEVLDVLKQIKRGGKSLDEYVNGAIYYGIKTGLNEAFIIEATKRRELIEADPRSAEVIKPYLRGQDIKRWEVTSTPSYLIAIQSSNDKDAKNIWLQSKTENEALRLFRKTYPAIYNHLMQFETGLRPRADQGKWFWELRACAYYKEFNRDKITWGNLATRPQFAIAGAGTYINAPATFLVVDRQVLKYLLGILNSKITQFFIASIAATRQGGFLEYKPMYVSQIPIAEGSPALKNLLIRMVEYVLYIKETIDTRSTAHARDAVMVSYFEQIIDALVYELYFPEALHAHERYIMRLIEQENLPIIDPSQENQIRLLRQIFERLFETNHPVRQTLFFLDSLPIIRIIEGKK